MDLEPSLVPAIRAALYLGDWYAHALYGTLFLFGCMIGRDEGFWAELASMRKALLALGVASFLTLLAVREFIAEEPGILLEQLRFFAIYLNRWTWVLVLCAWAHHLVRKPSRALTYATAAQGAIKARSRQGYCRTNASRFQIVIAGPGQKW